MKVLHYINNLGSGGAEKLLSDILPKIKKEGIHCELLIMSGSKNVKKFEDELHRNEIKISELKFNFYSPFQILPLISFIKKGKYDIVHAHLFPSQYWLAFASFFLKIKLIKTEHSVLNERKNYKLLRPLEKLVYSRYSKIIAITDEVANNLGIWANTENKTVVINNGVNLEQIENEQKRVKRNQYNFLAQNTVNILMTGRFDGWQKDQITLIKALSLLPENYFLYFAGEGSYLAECEEFVKKNNLEERVFFLGLRQDIYALMSLVDINVLSTNHEGLSGVVLESLASAQPFLGSDVVGVKEIVPDRRYLFEKGNFTELAEKIKEISEDETLKKQMVTSAIDFVKKFDTKFMIEKYVELYKSVIDER